jgi:hypothetical protein
MELPKASLTLPEHTGLVHVESTRSTAEVGMQEEVPQPRPRRVRPTRVESPSEPLEMVETRKDSPPPGQ